MWNHRMARQKGMFTMRLFSLDVLCMLTCISSRKFCLHNCSLFLYCIKFTWDWLLVSYIIFWNVVLLNVLQMTNTTASDVALHDSCPSLSVSQMDDAAGPSDTQQVYTYPSFFHIIFLSISEHLWWWALIFMIMNCA